MYRGDDSSKKVMPYVLRRRNGVFYVVLVWYEGKKRIRESHSIGEERNKSKAKHKGMELAREKEEYLEKLRQMGDKHIFVDSFNNWIESLKGSPKIRNNTLDGYRERSKNIIYFFNKYSEEELEDDICVEDITPEIVSKFYDYMLTYGKLNKKTGERTPLANATVKGYAALLHKFFKVKKEYCGWISSNPCDIAEKPNNVEEEIKEAKRFDSEQLKQLINFLESKPRFMLLIGMVKLCILYGLRRSECLALRWNFVDWEKNCIKIRRAVVRIHKGIDDRDKLKAKGSYRIYPILPDVKTILMEIKKEQIEKGLYADDGLVFLNKKGNQWRPDYCSKLVKKAIVDSGLPADMSFKTMRSTCVSMIYGKGWTESQITDWVGHTSFKVTKEHYLAPDKELKEKLGETLSDIF